MFGILLVRPRKPLAKGSIFSALYGGEMDNVHKHLRCPFQKLSVLVNTLMWLSIHSKVYLVRPHLQAQHSLDVFTRLAHALFSMLLQMQHMVKTRPHPRDECGRPFQRSTDRRPLSRHSLTCAGAGLSRAP